MDRCGRLAGKTQERADDRGEAAENALDLKWAEIAGLIRFSQDGSWEPTAVAKAWLRMQGRPEAATSCP